MLVTSIVAWSSTQEGIFNMLFKESLSLIITAVYSIVLKVLVGHFLGKADWISDCKRPFLQNLIIDNTHVLFSCCVPYWILEFHVWAPKCRSFEGRISVVKFKLFSRTPCQMSPMIPSILCTFIALTLGYKSFSCFNMNIYQIPLLLQGLPYPPPQKGVHLQFVPWCVWGMSFCLSDFVF